MRHRARCHDFTDSPGQTLALTLAVGLPVAAGLYALVGPAVAAGAVAVAVAAGLGRGPVTGGLPRGGADPDVDPECGPRQVACNC